MTKKSEQLTKKAQENVNRRFCLLRHFFIFTVINGIFLGFDYIVTPEADWAFIPLAVWGVALFGHSLSVVFNDFLEDWKDKLEKNEIKKLKSKD